MLFLLDILALVYTIRCIVFHRLFLQCQLTLAFYYFLFFLLFHF